MVLSGAPYDRETLADDVSADANSPGEVSGCRSERHVAVSLSDNKHRAGGLNYATVRAGSCNV